jgi:hypothetical protein
VRVRCVHGGIERAINYFEHIYFYSSDEKLTSDEFSINDLNLSKILNFEKSKLEPRDAQGKPVAATNSCCSIGCVALTVGWIFV